MGRFDSEGFDRGGQMLFDSLFDPSDPESTIVLVIEAARAKDRLDKLAKLTAADPDVWATILQGDESAVLLINSALCEQRQLTGTFRQLLNDIEKRQGGRDGGAGDDEPGLEGL